MTPTNAPSRRSIPVALAAVVLLVSAACTSGDGSASLRSQERGRSTGSPTTATGSLAWSRCQAREQRMVGMECASLEVPRDPGDPEGAAVQLALGRVKSSGSSSQRIGSIVLNPGGPGGSGIEFLAGAAVAFPEELRERFDLVSFDPRGVGASSPVRCLEDEAKDEQLAGDLSPDTPEELDRAYEEQGELLEACESNSGDMLEHMSTADVAADLDRIRAAVGDEKLTYVGFSYGTSIGAVYASLFPERVRALVLDGAVGPDPDWQEESIVQATGFERVFDRFVAACNADERCPLAPDAEAAVAQARASLESEPVTVGRGGDERTMGPDQFDYGLMTALYDTSTWATTASAVAQVRSGGAEQLFTLMDRQTGREPDGSYDNSSDAQVMVSCADTPDRPDRAAAEAFAATVEQAAPRFGRMFATSGVSCSGWPDAANPPPEISAPDAPPIVVVGTVGDPATPYEWAEQLSAALTSSVLLTYEGDGHTAMLTGGECIERALTSYLVDLRVPDPGTRCPANSETDPFAGVGEVLVDQLVSSGVPEELANCIVDGMVDQVGEDEFEDLVLSNDQEEIAKLAAAISLRCATGG